MSTTPQWTYFAADGSFGDADGLVIIDTSNFTESEWSGLDGAGDTDRLVDAEYIASQRDAYLIPVNLPTTVPTEEN
jgi:hypothetical protein